jgi:hypothetical protein
MELQQRCATPNRDRKVIEAYQKTTDSIIDTFFSRYKDVEARAWFSRKEN